jgi:TPR repeat protein
MELFMQIGFSNVIPLPDVDFTAPTQVSRPHLTDLIAPKGLNYSSRHYLSESGYKEFEDTALPVSQENLYASLFAVNPRHIHGVQSLVNQANKQLRKVLGDNTAGAKLDERHGLLGLAATKAQVLQGKHELIEKSGSWVKYLAPKALGLFMLAESSGAFSVRLGTIPRNGSPEDFSGVDWGFTTAPFQNLPFAFCVSWLGGEMLKRAHDWLQPKYLTGLERSFKEVSSLAEDLRKVSLDGANARMGGDPAANLVRTYGEHGRDFLESLMNEVDLSAYNYLLALKRVGPSIPVEQLFATTGVSAASLQLASARLEEARFVQTFTGRSKEGMAVVKDWTPSVVFSALGQQKRIAIDPTGRNRNQVYRARGDFSEPVGLGRLWDYSRNLEEALVYVEGKAKELFSLDKTPEAAQAWSGVKADLKAMMSYDAQAMFRIGVQLEKGVLGIPAGLEAVNLAKQFYLPAALAGEGEAQYRLGLLYSKSHGFGVQGQKNDKLAAEWLTKAADQKHPEAAGVLAVMHSQGRTKLEPREAFPFVLEYGNQALQAGERHPDLLFAMAGVLMKMGRQTKLAESYMVEAAEAGHVGAQREVGLLRLRQEKEVSAANYLKAPANQHDPVALYYLGELYLNKKADAPEGRQANELAAEYLTKAAELGHVDAHFKLGLMLFNGLTGLQAGEPDYEQAAFHFEKASKANHVAAKCHLADLYLERLVPPKKGQKSVQTAIDLYEQAIALGSQLAIFSLCKLLSEHEVLPASQANQKIVGLLERVIKTPDVDQRVFYKLGMMYANRLEGLPLGEEADALAVKYLQKADLPEASFQLAMLHLNGRTKVGSKAELQEVVADLLTPLAESGHVEAKLQLGLLCLDAEVDDEKDADRQARLDLGRGLLAQAAELGHTKASLELAWHLLTSAKCELGTDLMSPSVLAQLRAVPEAEKPEIYAAFMQRVFDARLSVRFDEAVRDECVHVLKVGGAAKQVKALRVLAVLCMKGYLGVLPSKADALAVDYLQQAVDLKDAESMFLLAMMTERKKNPHVISENSLKEAFALYIRAAEHGSLSAIVQLGLMYEKQIVPVADGENYMDKAAALYLRAAKQGNADGMYAVARLYVKGRGALAEGETHLALAEHWFSAARDKGVKEAELALLGLKERLSA